MKRAIDRHDAPPEGGRNPGVHIRLPASLLAAIDARSVEEGTTRSEAIRRLVELGLRVTPKAEQITEAKSHAAEASKLAAELGLKAEPE